MKIRLFTTIVLFFILPAFAFADVWFPTGSPTDLTPVVATWGIKVPGIPGGAGCLQRDSAGVITSIGSNCSSGTSFGYPFPLPGNATSTLTQFNGGLTAYASTTIGNGTQAGGLTVSGGATTTGNAYFASNVGVSTSSPGATFAVGGNVLVNGSIQTDNAAAGTIKASGSIYAADFYRNMNNGSFISLANSNVELDPGGEPTLTAQFQCCTFGNVGVASSSPWGRFAVDTSSLFFPTGAPEFNVGSAARQDFIIDQSGRIGIGTTTPGSLFAISTIANFTTATSTFYSSGGLNITGGGCFSINGNCLTQNSGTVTSVNASGGTTGLTFSGGPITTSGTLTLSGTLGVANGGTNATAFSGSALVASNAAGTTLISTSTISFQSFNATSTTATSTIAWGLNVNAINITGTATSTAASGINLATGCFAINNVCVGGSSFTNTLANGGTATTTFYNGGVVFSDSTKLTQSSAAANFFWDETNKRLGLGTSTPGSILSVNGVSNFTAATSTFYATGGFNLAAGCFAINNTCIGQATGGGQLLAIFATSTPSASAKPVKISFTGAANSAPSFTIAAAPTLTIASNASYIVVEAWGAGGGGSTGDQGGGGNNGVAGGNTDFGTGTTATTTANGGGLGTASTGPGGSGGTASGGDIGITGQPGSVSATLGGSAPLGGFGGGGGVAGASPGGGGGGGSTGSGFGGGGGGYTRKLYASSLASNYFYDVGKGGAGGTGGSGSNGAAGAAGGVLIYIFTSGVSNGSIGSGTAGQFAFYSAAGTNLSGTSQLFIDTSTNNIGVGTTTPFGMLSLNPNGITGPSFVIGSSTQTLFEITNNGHIIGSSTSPTLSSCGTGPSVLGDDRHGEVTVGSTASGCTVTFSHSYTSAPACVVSNQSMSVVNAFTYTISASALTLSETGLGGAKVDYMCEGFKGI